MTCRRNQSACRRRQGGDARQSPHTSANRIEYTALLRRPAPHHQVPAELAAVKAQLSRKYGKKLLLKAESNEDGCVDKLVSARLLFQTDPSPLLVEVKRGQCLFRTPPLY